jgi:hypothetical protein
MSSGIPKFCMNNVHPSRNHTEACQEGITRSKEGRQAGNTTMVVWDTLL